jgi:hypothetical protein
MLSIKPIEKTWQIVVETIERGLARFLSIGINFYGQVRDKERRYSSLRSTLDMTSRNVIKVGLR